jgi:hypothetical protein
MVIDPQHADQRQQPGHRPACAAAATAGSAGSAVANVVFRRSLMELATREY